MHPLLARALELGTPADGFTDDRGGRVSVTQEEGTLRAEVRQPGGAWAGTAWRCAAAPRPSVAFPDGVPFLRGLSCVAVREADRLTVSWPAHPPSTGVPGAPAMLGGLLGSPSAGSADPVARAWRRFTSEGALGTDLHRLEEALDSLVAGSEREGWIAASDERIEGPVEARVVRMIRRGGERSFTLSGALGVTSLVLLQKDARGSP